MTDKDIKDYCKNCDVEPPAMRFKCPECEHNTDNENNFAKDINVPRKEQIIKQKVCKYQYYWSDDVGCDGWYCQNPEQKGDTDCPYFPSDTYNCQIYVEGESYE